jgi:putative ABC transport system ATP-binding protein
MQIFQRLNQERNLTILLVTHESDIARFAKRVILFRDGKLRRDTPVEGREDAGQVLLTMPAAGLEEEGEE